MKFYKLCEYTLLDEMARAAKSVQFNKVKINADVTVTPNNVTNIKMYLLDQFDDETKAKVFNYIIDSLKDTDFDSYDDLLDFVSTKVSEAIKNEGGSQNATNLKYTTRVVFNTLGPNKLKAIVPLESEAPKQEEPAKQEDSEEAPVAAPTKKGVYIISKDNFLDRGLDELQAFPPSILEPLTAFFNEKDGESMPEMKIRLDIAAAVKEYLQGVDEDKAIEAFKLFRDGINEIMLDLRRTKSLHSGEVKKDDEGISPVFDPEEDAEPEEILAGDVEELTGYRPERDFDPEREFGVDFG